MTERNQGERVERPATPGEPETEAGRYVLDRLEDAPGYGYRTWREHILAIEAEARAESSAEMERLRAAAVAVCQLWFTDNAPDGSQHVRKAMLDLRAALGDSDE